jgi:hypothetical protein
MDIPREKKNKVRIDTIRLEGDQYPHPTAQTSIAPRGKIGQTYSKLHQSFFTSLEIPLPTNVDLCRTWVWPILTREKGPQKEVLIHSKNQALQLASKSQGTGERTSPPNQPWKNWSNT